MLSLSVPKILGLFQSRLIELLDAATACAMIQRTLILKDIVKGSFDLVFARFKSRHNYTKALQSLEK